MLYHEGLMLPAWRHLFLGNGCIQLLLHLVEVALHNRQIFLGLHGQRERQS